MVIFLGDSLVKKNTKQYYNNMYVILFIYYNAMRPQQFIILQNSEKRNII